MAVRLNSKFKPLFTSNKRYYIITGGRGGAKSFTTNCFAVLLTEETGHKILSTRYTMTSAEISVIPEFAGKISALGLQENFAQLKTEVKNRRTGSEVLFRGIKTSSGDQTANLKSIEGITTWILEEAEELRDEDKFDTIDLSIRTKTRQNRVILVLNPTDKEHWIWKRWFENHHRIEMIDGCEVQMCTHPDVEHIHTTYLDNIENLDPDWVENVRKLKVSDFSKYRHKIIGAWATEKEGTLYTKSDLKTFSLSDIRAEEREHALGYIDVADEGADYTAFPIGYIYRNRVYIVDVVFTNKSIDHSLPLSVGAFRKHNLDFVRVESNNQGSVFAKMMRQHIEETRVITSNSTANKHTRILMEKAFVKEYFYFLEPEQRSAEYRQFIDQILDYSETKTENKGHDDAPDGLSGLSKFIRAYCRDLFDPIPLENL